MAKKKKTKKLDMYPDERLSQLYAFIEALGVERQCVTCQAPLFPGRVCLLCGTDPTFGSDPLL